MNLLASTIESAVPSALVAGVALLLARPLARGFAGIGERRRGFFWALLILPILTPPLLIGYALGRWRLGGADPFGWTEQLYLAVMIARLTPIATLALYFLPSPVSDEGKHCFRLLSGQPIHARLAFHLRAAGRAPWIALALVFLIAFTDFELAAMWNVRTWTVVLFDAHAGGLALGESLRLVAAPAALELSVVALLLLALRKTAPARPSHGSRPSRLSGLLCFYLCTVALAVCVVPMGGVLVQAARGLPSLLETFSLGADLLASAAFALSASTAAHALSAVGAKRRWPGVLLSLPGLLGSLTLSLLLVALFQLPALRPAYDTMLPLLLALTFLLLPFALLLRLVMNATRPSEALFIARQTGHRELVWRLEGRRRFAAWSLLFCWAYFDFTASSILAPVGFTPVFVRLHNLMHYGQTAVLSAMVCATFAVPVAVLLLTAAVARLYARRDAR